MKKLELKDFANQYEYDEVTCFEHPMANIMEFLQSGYGRYFIMLSKFNGTYVQNGNNGREETLREMKDLLGIEGKRHAGLSYHQISGEIEQGIPMLAAVNLKELFYSGYYPDTNWNHWMLVNGYREKGRLVSVFDNTQFPEIGHAYMTFQIPFDLLKAGNKSYIRRYGSEYAVMSFQKKCEPVSRQEIIRYLMEKYLKTDLTVKEHYRQHQLTMLYHAMRESALQTSAFRKSNFMSDVEELKKKMICINKYRFLFWREFMNCVFEQPEEDGEDSEAHESNVTDRSKDNLFPESRIQMENLVHELDQKWKRAVILQAVKMMKREELPELVTEDLVEPEIRLQKTVRNVYEQWKDIQKQQENHLRDNHSDFANQKFVSYTGEIKMENENAIDSISGDRNFGQCQFIFKADRIRNWWDTDEAPKVLLGSPEEYAEVELTILETTGKFEESNVETGIFVRNKDRTHTYMIGIENQKTVVFSEIGISSIKIDQPDVSEIRLYIQFTDQMLEMGIVKNNRRESIVRDLEIDRKQSLVGIASKTWGKPSGRMVHCRWTFKTGQ